MLSEDLQEFTANPLIERQPEGKTSFFGATRALAVAEFEWRRLLKSTLRMFLIICLVVGQETFFVYFFTLVKNPTINYSEIEETFHHNHPPILAWMNTETPDGTSTHSLLELYSESFNEEEV